MLPRTHQSKVIAGPGRGQCCALCDHAIEMGDVCYQIVPGGTGETPRPLHFHVPCYRAWIAACSAMPRSYAPRAAEGSIAGE